MDERSERLAASLEPIVIAAALLVIPLLIIEESGFGAPWDSVAIVLNYGIWLVFVVEAVAMLSVVPDRWRWVREHPIDVAVVVLTPPFVGSLGAIRLFRLVRLVRLLRLAPVARRLFSDEGLKYTAALAALTAVLGGAGFAALEGESTSTLDGVYWAITTMTTVGYGDELPTTGGTKALAVAIMMIGIGFVAVLTGAVAQRFVEPTLAAEAEEVEAELDLSSEAILRELRAVRGQLTALETALVRRD